MNWSEIEGKWEEIKGLVKEKWAKLTDSDLLEIRGKGDQLKGKLRERYGLTRIEIDSELNNFISEQQDSQGN